MIAESGEITGEAGQSIVLQPAAEEFQILQLLDQESAIGRLDINFIDGVPHEMKILAETAVRISASPE